MPPDQRIQIKQNTILIFSVSTFLTVVSAVFWFGQQFEKTRTKIDNAVSVYEMDRWERKAQRLNAGWIGPGILDLRGTYQEHAKNP
jgi:hypothetical protein